uniref:non-specific serine/threonine protein kinase n=1 Tax=Ciona savignyi TaxID=51511 RepID=H2YX83_CIOSA
MLDALQYMHSREVLHRDLKPANILLVGDIVKLADFGVSKQLLLSTCHSAPAGTWAYMSPEMFEENYNSKSDIWSLGCVFYELFTLELICGPGAAKLMPHVRKLGNEEELPNHNEQRYNEIFKKMVDYDVKR